MKIEDALEVLKEMAGDHPCNVEYELWDNPSMNNTPCHVYIEHEGSIGASTFQLALDMMRDKLRLNIPEKPDINA